MGTWKERPDPVEIDVIAGALHLVDDLALDGLSSTIRLFEHVDPLLVFGLLLGRVDGSLLFVDVRDEDLDLFALFDLAVVPERREFGRRKDPLRLVADVDEDLGLVDLNDRPGDYVSATVHLDVAFRESIFHLDSLFHAPVPPTVTPPRPPNSGLAECLQS